VDASLTRTIPGCVPPGIDSGWLEWVWFLEHDAKRRDAINFLAATGEETNESDMHEVGVDGRVLIRAFVGEDVNLDLLETTEPKHLAGAELGEAAVADVVEILKRLTADMKELNPSVLEAWVDVDGESAFLVDSFSNLVTDIFTEEHHVDKGVRPVTSRRGNAMILATVGVDSPVAGWERAQLIDQDLPADLSGQLVDEWA